MHRHDLDAFIDAYCDLKFNNGKLKLEFQGNRIDLLAAPSDSPPAALQVLIDGKKPSQFPELYTLTRPSTVHGIWPGVIRISSEKPLILEDWRLRITESDEMGAKFKFEVHGSITGPDGAGSRDKKFVSNSGRVVIDPNDWHLERTCKQANKPLPKDFEIKWKAVPMFVDLYEPPKVDDPAKEYITTLAQGLTNEKHTLELIANAPAAPAIKAIRIHEPPLK